MAVYERAYRPYEGPTTPEKSRFLVLPRYAFQQALSSKLFVAFLIAWFLWPLFLALMIYLPHNLSILERWGLTSEELQILPLFRQNAKWFFGWFMIPMGPVAFVVTLVVGPALVSVDLRNNGLPLYLARPFSRTEYILGKMTVLAILLSAVSWIPGLVLFLLRSYFAGWSWFTGNLRIGAAIFLGSWIWILLLCVLSLALSAYLKWRPVAGMALLGVFFIASAVSGLLQVLLRTQWAAIINISDMMGVVWAGLFGVETPISVPGPAAWASLLIFCGLCVWLLYRKVRAYEVVR